MAAEGFISAIPGIGDVSLEGLMTFLFGYVLIRFTGKVQDPDKVEPKAS